MCAAYMEKDPRWSTEACIPENSVLGGPPPSYTSGASAGCTPRSKKKMKENNDLSNLENLNEESIIDNVEARYGQGLIHTFIGEVLLVVNPFRKMEIYGGEWTDRYKEMVPRSECDPHVYYTASHAYTRMRETYRNQCVLVSGESGAGKTESTKHMIRHITHIAHQCRSDLLERIVKANPLLEAFGNAQTVINNNSSRFGKFVELIFSKDGHMVGAEINEYLLEKSRVVHHLAGERSFHVFYYLFAGMPPEKLQYYYLEDATQHRILSRGGEKPRVFRDASDLEHCQRKYHDLERVLNKCGFSEDDVAMIVLCLAAILYVTNIDFNLDEDIDAAIIVDETPAKIVADLLVINTDDFVRDLLCDTTIVSGEEVTSLKRVPQAVDARDSMAKALYARLFSWIVRQINESLKPADPAMLDQSLRVGLLDLSGFENFSINSFEQLCINVANEQLQNLFNRHILQDEQHAYLEDGVTWTFIDFNNNDELLHLFMAVGGVYDKRPAGLLQLVDEECRVPRGTDASLLLKWQQHHSSCAALSCLQGTTTLFAVKHYAEEVVYDASGFLEKNRDRLSRNLKQCIESSKLEFITDLFKANLSNTGGIDKGSRIRRGSSRPLGRPPSRREGMDSCGGAANISKRTLRKVSNRGRPPIDAATPTMSRGCTTMTQHFRESLKILLKKVENADPHFVRCIKPNDSQLPNTFKRGMVAVQLNYSGVLQIAQIRKVGLPIRINFANFLSRYRLAGVDPQKRMTSLPPTGPVCQKVLQRIQVDPTHYTIGDKRVFLKDYVPALLTEEARKVAEIIIKRHLLGYIQRRRHKKAIHARRQQQAKQQNNQKVMPPVPPIDIESGIYGTHIPNSKPTSAKRLSNLLSETNLSAISEEDSVKAGNSSVSGDTQQTEEQVDQLTDSSSTTSDDDIEDVLPAWDIAQYIPRERISPSESFEGFVKALKVLMYVMLFIVIWVTSTVVTGSVLLLEAALNTDSRYRNTARVQLLACIIIPYVISFLVCVVKAVFGRIPWPPTSVFFTMVLAEALHTVGLVLLVFRVIPAFGSLYGLGLMHSICLIPALLKIFFSRRVTKKNNETSPKLVCRTVAMIMLDVVVLLLQLAAIGLPLVVIMFGLGSMYPATMAEECTDDLSHPPPQCQITRNLTGVNNSARHPGTLPANTPFIHLYWQIPLALLLTSVKWWENFVDTNRACCHLASAKKIAQNVRVRMNCLTTVLNIILTVGLLYLLDYFEGRSPSFPEFFLPSSNIAPDDDLTSTVQTVLTLTPSILVIFCGAICYYCCSLACKLKMQRVSFCIPLYLSVPSVAVIIVLQCWGELPLMPTLGGITYSYWCDIGTTENYGWYVAAGGVTWGSVLWLCGHVWYPEGVKLAMAERLFVTHLYNGVLLMPSMLLNRRKDERSHQNSDGCNDTNGYGSCGFPYGDGVTIASDTLSSSGDKEGIATKLGGRVSKKHGVVPLVYACATMWHETSEEMIQLLKSVFRMDADQSARRIAQILFKVDDPDFYEFEAHIFFDDAMELDDDSRWVINQFVRELIEVMDEAASSVLESEKQMPPPVKTPTPYGGRLTWVLPGGNKLVVHLKDKMKIRPKKRWSQVMYMYYLLGYRVFGYGRKAIQELLEKAKNDSPDGTSKRKRKPRWLESAMKLNAKRQHFGKSAIFRDMEECIVKEAENTFILALDGDVDFKPDAVRLLVDRMKRNEKTGAACGRIHPIGAGPLVWYQKFEYAIGHWFQKATEHVLGCVLCSPGCFSLFRGSALLDDNVMKKYTQRAKVATDFLQYDQGEDRWLCTLLLQQGYRVDYTAAADALTYAPTEFGEFFNQRRRWMPSTIANILDLLGDYKTTVAVNDNISFLYIIYQFAIMISTVLGPATIILAIASAWESVTKWDLYICYLLSISPVAIYIAICFLCSPKTQLLWGQILSTFYASVMMVVIVGIIISVVEDKNISPSLFFLILVVTSFLFAGIMHPYEFFCLPHGLLYLLCIPAGYLVLVIYSLANLHVISWGTREVAKRKSKKQIEAEKKLELEKTLAKQKQKRGFLSYFSRDFIVNELKDAMQQVFSIFHQRQSTNENETLKMLKKINNNLRRGNKMQAGINCDSSSDEEDTKKAIQEEKKRKENEEAKKAAEAAAVPVEEEEIPPDDPQNPNWTKDKELGESFVEYLDTDETLFWQQSIKKYLRPIKKNKQNEDKIRRELINLRNNGNFVFWMVNALWVLLNYMIQKNPKLNSIPIIDINNTPGDESDDIRTQPLSFMFMVFFALILILQNIGMIMHRWGTFLQLISITELNNPCRKRNLLDGQDNGSLTPEEAIKFTQILQKKAYQEPKPDYPMDDLETSTPSTSSAGITNPLSQAGTLRHRRGFSFDNNANIDDVVSQISPARIKDTLRKMKTMERGRVEDLFEDIDEHDEGKGVNGDIEQGFGPHTTETRDRTKQYIDSLPNIQDLPFGYNASISRGFTRRFGHLANEEMHKKTKGKKQNKNENKARDRSFNNRRKKQREPLYSVLEDRERPPHHRGPSDSEHLLRPRTDYCDDRYQHHNNRPEYDPYDEDDRYNNRQHHGHRRHQNHRHMNTPRGYQRDSNGVVWTGDDDMHRDPRYRRQFDGRFYVHGDVFERQVLHGIKHLAVGNDKTKPIIPRQRYSSRYAGKQVTQM